MGWNPVICHPPWYPQSSTVTDVDVLDVLMVNGVGVLLVNW
jgi:hypothetical protein